MNGVARPVWPELLGRHDWGTWPAWPESLTRVAGELGLRGRRVWPAERRAWPTWPESLSGIAGEIGPRGRRDGPRWPESWA